MFPYLQCIVWCETHSSKTCIDDSVCILKWLLESGRKHPVGLWPIKSDSSGTLTWAYFAQFWWEIGRLISGANVDYWEFDILQFDIVSCNAIILIDHSTSTIERSMIEEKVTYEI